MTEQEVLKLVLAGDPRAIRSLVDHFQPMVLRTARGFLRNSDDARDVAQEVFIDIFTNIHRFQGQSRLSTWVYRIAVNRSLNYLRSNKKRLSNRSYSFENSESGQEGTMNLSDPTQKNPAQILEQKEKSETLHAAIQSLPEKQRIAFTLAEYDDLSYKEIAEVMETSVSSVESLIFRGRKKLQEKLWKVYRNLDRPT
jgi:RNA polymerase sigma-70 factor (ECF subfamily)